MIRALIILLLGSYANVDAHAHESDTEQERKSHLRSTASFTYRNTGTLNDDQTANAGQSIPGALMGGEAYPLQAGAMLDDAQLNVLWIAPAGYGLHANLSAHQHGGDTALQLEELWLDYTLKPANISIDIAAGKMPSLTTPLAAFHPSQSAYSEAPLLSDVLWGRHFSSTGLRLSKTTNTFTLGIEVFNGDAWPMAAGENSTSVYLHYKTPIKAAQLSAGAWGMNSAARNRQDHRFSSGHSHSASNAINPASDYRFTGDIAMGGAFAELSVPIQNIKWRLRGEFAQQVSDGTLSDTTQASLIESTTQGARFESTLSVKNHQWALASERLVLENTFAGDVSMAFVDNAGLMNNGFEPTRYSAAWNYRYLPGLFLRGEITHEQVYREEKNLRYNFGLRWDQQWLL